MIPYTNLEYLKKLFTEELLDNCDNYQFKCFGFPVIFVNVMYLLHLFFNVDFIIEHIPGTTACPSEEAQRELIRLLEILRKQRFYQGDLIETERQTRSKIGIDPNLPFHSGHLAIVYDLDCEWKILDTIYELEDLDMTLVSFEKKGRYVLPVFDESIDSVEEYCEKICRLMSSPSHKLSFVVKGPEEIR